MEYHLPLLAMSEEQLKAFLNALEADTGLQAKIKAAVEGEIDTADETAAVLAIAKEAGFTITAADLLRLEAQNIMELSDEELESVTGGTMMGGGGFGRNALMGGKNATQLSFGSGCHPTSRLGNPGALCRM
jgi:predicted ribosomally synthesized peptide with nif11-like leader